MDRNSRILSKSLLEDNKQCEPDISFQPTLLPINLVRPGDWIYSFDGKYNRVIQVKSFLYDHEIIGLHHHLSDKILWLTDSTLIPCRKRSKLPKSLNYWSDIPSYMTEIRRYLRNDPTRAEQHLWSVLSNKKLGYKFRRQHSIGPYIIDFYNREGQIVIEVDGAGHFTSSGIKHGFERNQYIESLGIKVIHVTNEEVMNDLDNVVELIVQNCSKNAFPESVILYQEAAQLESGDWVFFGQDLKPGRILKVDFSISKEDIFYELLIQDSGTYLTEVCMVGII